MVKQQKQNRLVVMLRWLARAGSLVSVFFLLLFLFGEEMVISKISFVEWIGLLFFPIGVTVGMLLAWRWETLGGAVTVLSLLAFYGVMYSDRGYFPEGIWFMLFALPALVFLYCGLRSSKTLPTLRAV